jgi:hypothetical protein
VCYMIDVVVGQWDTGQARDMCDMMIIALGQWDTVQVSGMCVYDGCSSGTVGHRTR